MDDVMTGDFAWRLGCMMNEWNGLFFLLRGAVELLLLFL